MSVIFVLLFVVFQKVNKIRIKNYPLPTIEILSSEGNQGSVTEYNLEFTIADAKTLTVNGKDVDIGNGKISMVISLEDRWEGINIFARNKYKRNSAHIMISRDENEEEKQTRLIREEKEEMEEIEEEKERIEQATQREAEQKAWESSKAGQICKAHPEWSKNDCERLANNKIWIGMSYDMLVYKRGKPNSANPSNYGSGTEWQWCWTYRTPSCFYDDNDDGIIDSYN